MIAAGLLKLDLGCGAKVREGFTGVDCAALPGVERVDLLTFPWPWADASVDEVFCSHFFEHVPGRLRGTFMDELWRVLAVDATATIVVPRWDTTAAIADFTHEWPPVAVGSFAYFNRDARRVMGLEHYPVSCHFEVESSEFTDRIQQTAIRLTKRP